MTPVTIGIVGGSASGKSTYCKNLPAHLSDYRVASVKMDDYFRDPLPQMTSPVTGITDNDYNHPNSVDHEKLLAKIKELQECGEYDIILVEGTLLFCYEDIRPLFDLKIFIDLDSDVRMFRRVKRNIDHFKGHEKLGDFNWQAEYYLNYAKHREQEYALTTKVYADVILNGYKLDDHATHVVAAWVMGKCRGKPADETIHHNN
ncbi:MAG: hypothetical protein FWB93_03200 [Oscillospiraceae bacterium]|nr:hypothetical protein [Oscillospiraceae bacterium]